MTYEWDLPRIERCWRRCSPLHLYVWVIRHLWLCHVTLVIVSCHTYEWVMSHVWLWHVSHMNCNSICIYTYGSCHAHEWVMSHVRLSRDTHVQKLIWHVLMFFFPQQLWASVSHEKGHVTQIDESWHTHKSNVSRLWVMAHSESWHIWVMAHIYES